MIYYNQSEVASLHAEIEPDDSSEQLLSKVFRTSIQAIEETMSILDIAEFDRARILYSRLDILTYMLSVVPPR